MTRTPSGKTPPAAPRRKRRSGARSVPLAALALALLTACAGQRAGGPDMDLSEPEIPEPIRAPDPGDETVTDSFDGPTGDDSLDTAERDRTESTPAVPVEARNVVRPAEQSVELEGETTTLNIEGMALPAFINEVFGNVLGVNFQIASDLRERQDQETLRISQPQPPEAVFEAATQVLRSYGVTTVREEGLYRFVRDDQAPRSADSPLLVTGRALPSVPEGNRPVFYFVPMEVVDNRVARGWLKQAFTDTGLQVDGVPSRNALILRGSGQVVREAARALELFDQPSMQGRYGMRVNPRFRDAPSLAADLVELLRAEGYAAGQKMNGNSVIVLPMGGVGSVFVFATSQRTLDHVRDWAESLDQPARSGEDGRGIFYYPVENTGARSLAEVVSRVLAGSGMSTTGSDESTSQGQDNAGSGGNGGGTSIDGGGLVVDEVGNALIFRGEPETWGRIRPLIERMDRPVPQVLIEVAVAEVTINDQRELGVEGLLQDLSIDGVAAEVSTQGGLGLGGSGLTATLNDPGDAQVVLNAFDSNERVKILSRPHVMVKSGQDASIDVGTEVPVITTQASSDEFDQDGQSGILQEIQFRETGVILEVSPIVRGGDTVDVQVRQEVSEAQPTQSSNINSPSIFRRAIDTSLSLRDGTPVLMGGLISEDSSVGTSGVPFLKDLPGLGRLFRADSRSGERTELMILMIPYILRTHDDAAEVTRAFERALREEGGQGSDAAPEAQQQSQ